MAACFEHGVHLVALAPITDPAVVVDAIAHALGLKEVGGQSLVESLRLYLQDKDLLLLLDNFEQVVEAAAEIAELLMWAPRLKVLATSRVALRIYGEQEYPVPPMSLPTPAQISVLHPQAPGVAREELDLFLLSKYEAVALFVQRATAVKPDFALTRENAPAVVEICRRVDCLPLGIELAAARVKILPPQAILARLESSLQLLTGGAANLPQRQQTMRNAIAWSYDLLADEEKALFRRMSVFVGGCTLEAVESLCRYIQAAGSELARPLDVVEGAASLVDKSLLRQDTPRSLGAESRLVMLETIREFGLEMLASEPEGASARAAHARYFLELAETADAALVGAQQVQWLDQLETEHDNVRAALRNAVERGDTDTALRLGGALGGFWDIHGYWTEGREWLAGILSMQGAGHAGIPRARALSAAGWLARRQGDRPQARTLIEEGLAIYRTAEESMGIAKALNMLGVVAVDQRNFEEAHLLHEEALAIARRFGDRAGIAAALTNLGSLEIGEKRFAQARTLLEESIEIMRELGDKWGMAGALNTLGVALSVESSHYRAARLLYEESLAMYHELGDKRGMALTLNGVGEAARSQGDYQAARAHYEESLAIFRDLNDKRGTAMALHNLGHMLRLDGHFQEAAASFQESLEIYRETTNKVDMATCLAGLGETAADQGLYRRAAWLLGKAEEMLESASSASGTPSFDPTDRAAYEQSLAVISGRVGEAVLATSLAEGRAMTLDEILARTHAEIAEEERSSPSLQGKQTPSPSSYPAGLTRREVEVLRLVATGLTDAQVAERLFLSAQTVHAHLRNIYSKLGVANRLEATRFAIEHSLLVDG
jgi:predicted ATPase/DNA-binding CsgD family transcriptional regulator/uncharacterized protein HemY